MFASRFTTALLMLVGFLPTSLAAAPDDADFFEKKVRPLLVEKCQSCHGAEKQKGNLRVDSMAALLAGGDRGAAVVPGKPDESLIVRVLAYDGDVKMPPKNKLPNAEIAVFKEWVQRGAAWPESIAVVAAPKVVAASREFTAEERGFWAFQPVRPQPVPATGSHPVDAFLLAKLREQNQSFAPPADRRTLIRRITFDLTGLPPTATEVDAFVKDDSTDAYEKLVDRLLASSAYGEKWGRRWLDVARYADSNGMDENLAYVNAWRYRDWVIRAFNSDKPYDEFVRDQIAGDLVPGGTEAERAERMTATGFLVIGPKMLAEDDPMKMRMDIIDEQLDTAGQAFLGLTLGCARCHDHKFDPITAADYYGLAGMFYSTKTMVNFNVVATWNERAIGTPEQIAKLAEHRKEAERIKNDLSRVERPASRAVAGIAGAQGLAIALRKTQADAEKAKPPVDEVMAVEDAKSENLKIHLRGNHLTLGAEAPRRLPRIVAGDAALSLAPNRSGRLEFADWMTRTDNPLTARVMVNRIWAGHFGTGLVRTPDNFGRLGERPTHPELLDWLAAEFVRSKWSVKKLHKLIVTSNAYKMSSGSNPNAVENKLYSHFNRRRLDAEEVRDGLLAVAGLLERTSGGTLLKATPRQYVTSTANKNYDTYNSPRRTVYLPIVRSAVYDVLQTLDFADPSVPNGKRSATTIPTQALLMLNSSLADRTSEAFAKSLLEVKGDDAGRIREGYLRAFGREPSSKESEKLLAYLQKSVEVADPKLSTDEKLLKAWRGLCRVLFASNEFVFVE